MTTSTLLSTEAPTNPAARVRAILPQWVLLAIVVLSAVLNFVNLEASGDANTYYTAAVEAMLQSPSNFFFVAAEPGGSVTIDKPPLGLWLQALSALVLGVNGFAVMLPQILAGIFSVPLLYALIRRWFGTGAGLIAALVMAITPVSVAVQRNNTMDATLIFTLLLAAWAFVRATESASLRWLLLGGVLIGLGFNIKMLQAFLPLPAFYALYFFGAHTGWGKKVLHLALTTAVLLGVSLAWIVAVDLTPADSRPYVGSSTTNSALELAIGYNGLQRLLRGMGGGPGGNGGVGGRTPPVGPDGRTVSPPLGTNGQPIAPPTGAVGGMFGEEIGTTGVLRLITQPLDNEIGWLLPFALFSLVLLIAANRVRLPVSTAHQGALLWGGWLMTQGVFFSAASFFHAYYLAMFTPPLAALVGIGLMRLWEDYPHRKLLTSALLILSVGGTLLIQARIAAGYTSDLGWLIVPALALGGGTLILVVGRFIPRVARASTAALVALVIALTAVPAVWAGLTVLNDANRTLPSAYAGSAQTQRGPDGAPRNEGQTQATALGADRELIDYLQANTQGMRWMLAVNSSMQGADLVLDTGRGVLYMGGFNGQDPVVDVESLQFHVDAGDLRYVLSGGMGGPGGNAGTDSAITDWLTAHCTVITDIHVSGGTLYDCTAP